MARVLFITWDGPGQTYLESLFLPIFSRLKSRGFEIGVFQLTWAAPDETDAWRDAALRHGVGLELVRVPHWLPLLTAPAVMSFTALQIARRLRTNTVSALLARSIIPAGIAMAAHRLSGSVSFVFDADGLPADERVEFAGWSRSGAPYRVWRRIEAHAVRSADAVIVRTERAKRIVADRAADGAWSKIAVIPNGKDTDTFQPMSLEDRLRVRALYEIGETAPLLVFVGSVGPQYHLREALQILRRLLEQRPDARMLVLTGDVSRAAELVREQQLGSAVQLKRLSPAEVPRAVAAADLGMALRSPTFSQQAVSPIKVAEYLLCGVPVLGRCGVGDLETQLSGVGRLVEDLSAHSLEQVVHWLMHDVLPHRELWRERCRARGVALFSLSRSAEQYAEVLRKATSAGSRRPTR